MTIIYKSWLVDECWPFTEFANCHLPFTEFANCHLRPKDIGAYQDTCDEYAVNVRRDRPSQLELDFTKPVDNAPRCKQCGKPISGWFTDQKGDRIMLEPCEHGLYRIQRHLGEDWAVRAPAAPDRPKTTFVLHYAEHTHYERFVRRDPSGRGKDKKARKKRAPKNVTGH